jgi:pimeloyl-ACP methyl ester carboxylesterase
MIQPRISFSEHPPQQLLHEPPLVFIHGMGHGAWCWEWLWVPRLQEAGYRCITLNLRGHGESEGWEKLGVASIKNYVQDVRYVLSHLNTLPVVIGHSMGGFIVQKLLLSDTPLKGAVTVASVPASGFGVGLWRLLRHEPLRFLKGLVTLSTTPFSENPRIVRKLCFSPDAPEERVHNAFMSMQPESFRAFLDMFFLNLHKPRRASVPSLFMAAGRDFIIDNKALEKTAGGFGAEFVLLPDVAHDMMLDTNWEKACDTLINWLNKLPD